MIMIMIMIRYVTSWCYVFIALDGDAFCPACNATYRLLTGNPLTAAAVGLMQAPLLSSVVTVHILYERLLPAPMQALLLRALLTLL